MCRQHTSDSAQQKVTTACRPSARTGHLSPAGEIRQTKYRHRDDIPAAPLGHVRQTARIGKGGIAPKSFIDALRANCRSDTTFGR